jgi:hypothetical protein
MKWHIKFDKWSITIYRDAHIWGHECLSSAMCVLFKLGFNYFDRKWIRLEKEQEEVFL